MRAEDLARLGVRGLASRTAAPRRDEFDFDDIDLGAKSKGESRVGSGTGKAQGIRTRLPSRRRGSRRVKFSRLEDEEEVSDDEKVSDDEEVSDDDEEVEEAADVATSSGSTAKAEAPAAAAPAEEDEAKTSEGIATDDALAAEAADVKETPRSDAAPPTDIEQPPTRAMTAVELIEHEPSVHASVSALSALNTRMSHDCEMEISCGDTPASPTRLSVQSGSPTKAPSEFGEASGALPPGAVPYRILPLVMAALLATTIIGEVVAASTSNATSHPSLPPLLPLAPNPPPPRPPYVPSSPMPPPSAPPPSQPQPSPRPPLSPSPLTPPMPPPHLPPPAPPDVVHALNERWEHGRPSATLAEAGILVHQFDRFEFESEKWIPSGDHLACSLVNKGTPAMYRLGGGGIILAPTNRVLCSWTRDSATSARLAGGCAGAEGPCTPAQDWACKWPQSSHARAWPQPVAPHSHPTVCRRVRAVCVCVQQVSGRALGT